MIESGIERFSNKIAMKGCCFIDGATIRRMCEARGDTWAELSDCWNRLTLDRFMGDNGKYRYRRYAALRYDPDKGQITVLPHASYEQPKYVNPLNGGVQRYFDPIEVRFLENALFRRYIHVLAEIFERADGSSGPWEIRVHPYRIVAEGDAAGKPTPEGLHRDGVDYICTMMVKRHMVRGGISSVYDSSGIELMSVMLSEPLDTLLADDARTLHSVSEVFAEAAPGYRDVLVLAYTKTTN